MSKELTKLKTEKFTCSQCGTIFEKERRYVKYRLKVAKETRFYCGKSCANEALKTNTLQTCTVCKKEFYCSVSQLKSRNRKTCSMKCRGDSKQSKKVGGIKKRTGLKHKAQILVNKCARLRDCAGTSGGANCISCGVYHVYDEMDGGHFIPITSAATRYNLININAQCRKCNRYLRGNVRHYYKAMIVKYGIEEVEKLESLEFTSKKWTVEELEEIIANAKQYIKEME